MSSNFEQVLLVGTIRSEIEMRYTPSGTPVVNFTMPTDRTWKDKDGEKQQHTNWWRITAWNKLAEFCSQWLQNGSAVVVVGELTEAKAYTRKDGGTGVSLDVRAFSINFAPTNGDSPGHSSDINVQDAESIPF